MPGTAIRVGRRPREFVGVVGPDAASYLQAMVSNDVEALGVGDACEALLLTAKARVIAPLVVVRRGVDDFLLLTEPDLGETVQRTLLRSRFAAKCAIELETHASVVVVGREAPPGGIANHDYGIAAYELVDEETPAWGEITDEELELLRIRAASPRFGHELDDRVLPAEAGLEARAIDFEKGCYPGQEPIARQHYRGRVNRTLRVLELDGDELPEVESDLVYEGKVVGRVTSAVTDDGHVVALAYVRVEVPREVELRVGERGARQLDLPSARP
jgi:folate-binding protein YgfZ